QAALGIDVGLRDLHGQERALAVGREPAGQRHAEADGERLGLRVGAARDGDGSPRDGKLVEGATLDAHWTSSNDVCLLGSILARPTRRCHPERSEGTFLLPQRSLASLGMTPLFGTYSSGGGPAAASACWPKIAPWISGENITCALQAWASRNSRCMAPVV